MADKYYSLFSYPKAIELYEYAYKKDTTNISVLRKLAGAYEKVNQPEKVMETYERMMKLESLYNEADVLKFAGFLRKSGDHVQANQVIRSFNTDERKKTIGVIDLDSLKENLARNSSRISVNIIPFNSENSDFAPVVHENQLIFASTRNRNELISRKYNWNDQPFLDYYVCSIDESGKLSAPSKLEGTISTPYHEGAMAYSEYHKAFFVTRNNYKEGKLIRNDEDVSTLKIYLAKFVTGQWNVLEEFKYNSEAYSVGHPTLSDDGLTMYFVSDMPGGYGGTDIYRSEYVDEQWTRPVNMGPNINTSENEAFPFAQGDKLYFSSNGRLGLGGLDVYRINRKKFRKEKASNLGRGINSQADDFSFFINEDKYTGYFASNREGVGDDDIYAFEMDPFVNLRVNIRSLKDSSIVENAKLGIAVINHDVSQEEVLASGMKTFSLKGEETYKLEASKELFLSDFLIVDLDIFDPERTVDMFLKPLELKVEDESGEMARFEVVDLENIYFGFDRYNITRKAKDTLDKLVEKLRGRKDYKVILTSYTDSRGTEEYNLGLSKSRAESTARYLIGRGLNPVKLLKYWEGENFPVVDCAGDDCPEKVHQKNRRTEFYIVVEK
ncbi:MAG: OmpA family protein [Cytophagales bacterium]|nr:OmpA family protein [Cytophagales bacterium]